MCLPPQLIQANTADSACCIFLDKGTKFEPLQITHVVYAMYMFQKKTDIL
jgi:hypothetical protein